MNNILKGAIIIIVLVVIGYFIYPYIVPPQKVVPVITWDNPANISVGMLLGGQQLNAKANVPGSYVYIPPAGTKLGAGDNQVLRVDFTPTDTTHYTSANAQVKINVKPVPVVPPVVPVKPVVPIPVVPAKPAVINKNLVGQYEMVFMGLFPEKDPANVEAQRMYNDNLQRIKNANKIALIIIEPHKYQDGKPLNYETLANGGYDGMIRDTLNYWQQNGVGGKGTIYTILSESNGAMYDPDHPTPEQYVAAVNRVAGIIKEIQPEAQTAILLDSSTQYSPGVWGFRPLTSYVTGLRNVDIFILEGFPRADEKLTDAAQFVDANEITADAKAMSAKLVIINTGAASNYRGYNSPSSERQQILDSIYNQVLSVKQQLPGKTVVVNVFVQDKSKSDERVDWSFKSADYPMLKSFMTNLTSQGIGVSFFDPDHGLNTFLQSLT